MSKENQTQTNKRGFKHWQQISFYLVVYDAVAVTAAYFLALLVRFDFRFSMIPVVYLVPWQYFAPYYVIICIAVFWRCHLYNSIWRFASYKELQRITVASIITTIIHIVGITIVLNAYVKHTEYTVERMPFSYFVMGAIFQAFFIVAIRFSYRFVLLLRASRHNKTAVNTMVVGLDSIIGAT